MRVISSYLLLCLRKRFLYGILSVVLLLQVVLQAETAVLTPQDIVGTSRITDEVQAELELLGSNSVIKAGNVIFTDLSARVDLLGEDGSFLEIGEGTELSVLEYEFNADQKVRIARFAILEGVVTADAAHLDYETNVFEIETPTVTANFKFSKLTVEVDKDGNTTFTLHNGLFEFNWTTDTPFWQKNQHPRGTVTIQSHQANEVAIRLNVPQDASIRIATDLFIDNLNATIPLMVEIDGQIYDIPGNSRLDTSNGEPQLNNTPPPPKSEDSVPPSASPIQSPHEVQEIFQSLQNETTSSAAGLAPSIAGTGENPLYGDGMPAPSGDRERVRVGLRTHIDIH